jgi:hypothetical protein
VPRSEADMRKRAATIMDIVAFFRSSTAQADHCKIGAEVEANRVLWSPSRFRS